MVVFLDFATDDEEPSRMLPSVDRPSVLPDQSRQLGPAEAPSAVQTLQLEGGQDDARQPNTNGRGFAAALACYPVALSLSSHLDLNDLYALSSTCRGVHASLSQFSQQLVSRSLRCTFDCQPLLADVLANGAGNIELSNWTQEAHATTPVVGGATGPYTHAQIVAAASQWPRIPRSQSSPIARSSKIGTCARDLVAPCRKCGTVVCRNCASKPPSNRRLGDRFRRLCHTCLDAPISAHFQSLVDTVEVDDSPPSSSASSTRSQRSISSSSNSTLKTEEAEFETDLRKPFTSAAFCRDACTCATRGVYLCSTCGQSLAAADTTYKRVWTWRSRYSTHIGGGLGTGLGVGNQGQKCGRENNCLEKGSESVCWVEIDCSEGRVLDHDLGQLLGSRTGTPVGDGQTPEHINKPGYFQQEIEGIGGVVKKKVKKRVKVGATVWEYDDERKSGKYLDREASEKSRSWCGWCGRVCLGEKDRQVVTIE